MNCLKCGTAIPDGGSFCENCLKTMEEYPVPKDTVLVLPTKSRLAARNAARKRSLSTEELLAQSRKQLQKLRLFSLFQSLAILLLVGACVYVLLQEKEPAKGQNYSTVSTSATSGALPLEKK